jgi:alpha-tubulin suppressor-like RCC1 family protein
MRKKIRRTAVLGLSAITALALAGQAGIGHVAWAAAISGPLQAWGDGLSGQLGNGGHATSDKPVLVHLPASVTITDVAVGGTHTVALGSTGQVYAWGNNYHGELGGAHQSNTPVPVDLPKGTVVTQVAAGDGTSMAVTAGGQVYSWGDNQYGQLGDGSNLQRKTPVAVALPKQTKVVAVGTSYNYSIALTAGGHVFTWGYNGSGQLGNGFATASEIPIRVKIPVGVKITAIANGGYDALALTSTGTILAWGSGSWGQLGDGSRNNSDVPVTVKLPRGVKIVAISAGSQHSLALTATGEVLAWGRNSYGQVGDGNLTSTDRPARVKIPAADHVTAISAGGGFSLALTSSGQELAWGHNTTGQLGDGALVNSDVPVRVLIPAGWLVVKLSTGPTTRHSMAIVQPATP